MSLPIRYPDDESALDEAHAIHALAALAQDSRLRAFRLLAKRGARGLAAGQIAEKLKVPQATLSFHLKELLVAGLVTDRREGRSVIYAVNAATIRSLLTFLLDDCCGGRPELCGPSCGPPTKRRRARSPGD